MSELIDKIVAQLNSASTVEDLDGCAWVAGDLLEKAHSQNYLSGFEYIDREEVSDADARRIQTALLEALPRNSDGKFVGCILSALNGSQGKRLKGVYLENLIEHLRKLKASNSVVYSALLGLQTLGESVFETNPQGGSSQSLIQVDKNIRQANKYLQSLGIVEPW